MREEIKVKYYAHYCAIIINRLIIAFYFIPNFIKLKWWGVNFSRSIKFDGLLRIRRYPESKILLGNGCYFSMSSRHNLIGINRPCILSTQTSDATISVGNSCGFSGTVIGAFKSINIGNNVKFGANTLVTDGDWHLEDPRATSPKSITIKDNVWLGANSVVLKGVTIGENTLIGANSVVTKSMPANVIAAGNPCTVLRNNCYEYKSNN